LLETKNKEYFELSLKANPSSLLFTELVHSSGHFLDILLQVMICSEGHR